MHLSAVPSRKEGVGMNTPQALVLRWKLVDRDQNPLSAEVDYWGNDLFEAYTAGAVSFDDQQFSVCVFQKQMSGSYELVAVKERKATYYESQRG